VHFAFFEDSDAWPMDTPEYTRSEKKTIFEMKLAAK